MSHTPPQPLGVPGIRLFSTCPQSRDTPREQYRERITEVARWSEAAGCEGLLVYTDNGIVDPWLVAQLILESTRRICPLVAVQPAYTHPYTVAKMIGTLSYLHRRRVYVNLVAGGFRNDLDALGDTTAHDERYARALEYGRIIVQLTAGESCTLEGKYYTVRNLRLVPPVDPELAPGLTVSGSSPAGQAVAASLGAIAIKYPRPPEQEPPNHDDPGEVGMRVGIIARDTSEEAWRVARDRFPSTRAGVLAQQLAGKVSDSSWRHQLSALTRESPEPDSAYWLGPFETNASFCPYLVGDHDAVAGELRRYMELGFSTFLLDIPREQEDLTQARRAFDLAVALRR